MIKNVMKVVKEIEKNQSGADEFPVWWDGKQLDESAFCEWFAYKHELIRKKKYGLLRYKYEG